MTGASGRWPLRLLLLLLCVLVNGEIPASSGPHRRPLTPEAPAHGPPAQQTRKADERIVRAVEARLLDVFGLSSRPRPSGSAPIPAYMKELYQSHLQASRTRPQRKEHFRAHGRGPVQANTVRSFYHRDLTPSPDCPERSCITLWFNLTQLPSTEAVTAAELRIFKDLHQLRQASAAGSGRPHSTRVEVHEVMRPAGRDSETIARLLDTRQLALSGEPWESFDVHPAVLKWQRTPQLNHGLEVRVLSDSPAVSTDAHVRLRRSTDDDGPLAKWQSERPLLVTYTDDGKGANSRVKRSSSSSSSGREDGAAGEKAKKGRRKRENARRERRRRRRGRRNRKKKNRKKGDRRRRKQKNECRRHALYVDFSDVGWNDWIVAPTGYNAYYCSGECNFPLQDHANTTNHAIVQTLVNSVDPSAVPKACCVPTELSAISMLYLDEYEMVVLKNYQDMVVEACGCR